MICASGPSDAHASAASTRTHGSTRARMPDLLIRKSRAILHAALRQVFDRHDAEMRRSIFNLRLLLDLRVLRVLALDLRPGFSLDVAGGNHDARHLDLV